MNKVESEKNYFRCGVCGFKFTQPLVVFKRKNQLSKGYIIPTKPEALFVEVDVKVNISFRLKLNISLEDKDSLKKF